MRKTSPLRATFLRVPVEVTSVELKNSRLKHLLSLRPETEKSFAQQAIGG